MTVLVAAHEVVALSEVAKQLFSTSDPRQPTGQSNIENRSRCYSQFSELNVLNRLEF